MKTIPLTQGFVALVDDSDFERVARHKWCALKIDKQIYAVRNSSRLFGPSKTVLLHRFILDAPAEVEVDHENGNGLDCQRLNLRTCTHVENQRNRGPNENNQSGYKGVSWNRSRQKWEASIGVDGKTVHLGRFDDVSAAAQAYNDAAQKYHGEFAYLNVIP